MNANNNDRSYLYGRLEVLLRRYEEEARKAVGLRGESYIDIHYNGFNTRPMTTVKMCLDHLHKRTDLSKILKGKKPETEHKLSSMITEIFTTIEDLYGDNDDPLEYPCVFGASWQERELDK